MINFEAINKRIEMNKLPIIGMGSGRAVYELGNNFVVKKARNKKGLAQNKAEYMISKNNKSDLFAEVVSVSDDYKFVIMKKATKIYTFDEVLNYYKVRNLNQLFKLDSIRNIIYNNELLLPDLYRKSSWGIINGRPVLVDYGFTKEVKKYYRLF